MKLSFSSRQQDAIRNGKRKQKQLIRVTKKAALGTLDPDTVCRHTYIFGPQGVGKSHNMRIALNESGVKYVEIGGTVSMRHFAVSLAVLKYKHPNEKIVILIDDCDALIDTSENLNIMKKILDPDYGFLDYNKNVSANHVAPEGTEIHSAILAASDPDRLGFRIDCNNFSFVVTSNIPLKTQQEMDDLIEKGKPTDKIRHQLAFADRFWPKSCDFTREEQWGNIASVILQDEVASYLSEQQKIFLLDFIDSRWDRFRIRSIRVAQKMAETLKEEGEEDIIDAWETDWLI